MKNIYKYLLFLPFLLLLDGCTKKNYYDTLPGVQMVSAIPYGQDSLLITGEITYIGPYTLDYVGFAYSTQPDFDILTNQLLFNGSGVTGQFSTIIPGYPDSTYYFKCFAATDYGYTASGNYKYTVPNAKPDTAPCSLKNNVIIDNSNSWTMAYITPGLTGSYGNYQIQAYDASSTEVINIYFNLTPTNGIYTTEDVTDFTENPYNRFAVLVMDGSFTPFTINAGGYVYVAQNADKTTTISFCSLNYTAFSTTIYLSGKITF